MTGRATPEWIGAHPETPVPPRVVARIDDRHCSFCGVYIPNGVGRQIDHIVALCNGGENRESNLQILCTPCHKLKTRLDVRDKSIVARKHKKALGIKAKTGRPIPGSKLSGWRKPFNGPPVRRPQ